MSTFQEAKTSVKLSVFEKMKEHQQVLFCNDEASGLRAIIAIHDTTLGPALGGCRMRPYASEEEALEDVLRLSKGMTYKCAAADVDFGGGKAVIIGDPQKDKTPELFRALGQFVQSLNGRYYTGCDMGTLPDDFVHTMKETEFVVGGPEEYGGSGDSSVPTAFGVMQGIRAAAQYMWQSKDLKGKRFAVQGLGKVGFKVAETLLSEGAHVFVTDIFEDNVLGLLETAQNLPGTAERVNGNDIFAVDADMLVPCAIGGIINDQTIGQLKVKAICGAANNQLHRDDHGLELFNKGILYVPDYIANAGGLIQVSDELYGSNKSRVLKKTEAIYDTLMQVFADAELHQIPTAVAANRVAEQRIELRKRQNSFFSHRRRPKWNVRN